MNNFIFTRVFKELRNPFLGIGVRKKKTLSDPQKRYKERIMTLKTLQCPLLKRFVTFS